MNLMNLEDDKFKDITVKGHKFKIRYISPLDRVQITHRRIGFQNGNPVDSLTQPEFEYFENIAINDVCIEESPKEFNENESCVNWPDIEIINEVAGKIKEHTEKIQSKLKKNKPIIGGEKE
jgi:hypothetical protein